MIALVTVMYGSNPLYELELFGSVLSALSHNSNEDIEIIVYTDRDLSDFPLPVTAVQFDPKEWDEWTYNGAATHFVKMHVMQRMLATYQCPVLYFDTDVFFLESPTQIAQAISPESILMHACEGPIESHSLWQNVVAHLRTSQGKFSYPIKPSSPMYNSGIMGMLPEHLDTMKKATKLAQELYQFEAVFSIDQFSTCTAFLEEGTINTCESTVLHYWGWRRKFMHSSLEEIRTEWEKSDKQSPPDFTQLQNLTSTNPVDSMFARIKYGFTRKRESSRFAYLAYLTARRIGSEDQEMSQAWLRTCLELVNDILHPPYQKLIEQTYKRNDFFYLDDLDGNTQEWINNQNLEEIRKIKSELETKISQH